MQNAIDMESRQEFTIVIDRHARMMEYRVNGERRGRVVDFGYTGEPDPNILGWLRRIFSSIDAEAAGYPHLAEYGMPRREEQ